MCCGEPPLVGTRKLQGTDGKMKPKLIDIFAILIAVDA
jgi:hypothetical protein